MKVLFFLKNIFLLSVLAIVPVFAQNYEISITLNTRNDTVILCHFFARNNLWLPDDTVVLQNGKGVFRGSKQLEKGVYFLFNDGKRLFDFMIGDNKKFGIEADTTDLIRLTKFSSSPENDIFYEFQRYNAERSVQFQQLTEQYQKVTADDERNTIRSNIQELRDERIKFIEKLVETNQDLFVSKFLRILVPVETKLPEPPRDEQGNVIDPNFQYRWYRAHFFDNLNIFDPDMLRTPFYEEKMMDFITRTIPQHTDTICAEADIILTKAKANDEIFRCILVSIFNHYATLANNVLVQGSVVPENVWVHLAEKWYIPYATFSSADYLENLQKEVEKKKPNLMGKLAPPMEMLRILPPDHFKAAALDTAIKFDVHAGREMKDFRRELKNKFTAVVFWDYSCGHCKTFLQEMHQVYEEHKNKGLEVITVQTVNTREAKGAWIDFVNQHQMHDWINSWSPYNNNYKDLYDISSTPQLFLLDEKGTIILKRMQPEHFKEFFENQTIKNQQ